MNLGHTPALISIARRIAGDDAEDAVQNALLRAWLKEKQYRGDCPWSTWVAHIVVNESMRIARRRAMTAQRDFIWLTKMSRYHPDTPEQIMIRHELARAIRAVFHAMPPSEQRAIDREMAGIRDSSIAFMRARTRARMRLRAAGVGGP